MSRGQHSKRLRAGNKRALYGADTKYKFHLLLVCHLMPLGCRMEHVADQTNKTRTALYLT
jgi:hypothetical protein